MGEHRELERTLEAPPDWALPDLAAVAALRVAGVHAAVELEPVDLDAIYLDSEDLRLLAHGATLRRRTGGGEDGWHLKLPAGDGSRAELQRPLDAGADPLAEPVPPDLAALVTGLALGATLEPVARLVTRRVVTDLRSKSGDSLVTVARDEVRAEALIDADGDPGWDEIEVEATGGTDALLDAVVEALAGAGATVASSRPKLARALGATGERPALPDDPTAGDVVRLYLREQVDELIARDPDVRRDVPDAVHQARVATRRLRSALATFRPVLGRDATEPLRAELAWWGGVLGIARDAEVRRDRLAEAVDDLPGTLVRGTVREDLVEGASTEYREAWRIAVEKQSGPRYLALLRELDAFAADPPFTARARRPARKELRRHVRRARRRVVSRHRAAFAGHGEPRGELLHDTRKAAKRARYAAEAVEPVFGHRARLLARRMNAVQDALGAQHDAIELAELLRREALAAEASGQPSFTYGVLVAGERSRARHALEAHRDAWERAQRPKVHGWTRKGGG